MNNEQFTFTVTDLARFLSKSPVTLRGWERKGLVDIPRDGAERKLTAKEVMNFAIRAYTLQRITPERLQRIKEIANLLIALEKENYEDRNRRRTKRR